MNRHVRSKMQQRNSFMAALALMFAATIAADAAAVWKKSSSFSARYLKELTNRSTKPARRKALTYRFARFKPSKPEHVDLLYSALHTSVQESATKKLRTMKDARLLERSRRYVESTKRREWKVALKVIVEAKDLAALPVLRKLSNKNVGSERVGTWMAARNVRAHLQDPKMLDDLFSSATDTPDSTLAMLYGKMIAEYGEKGSMRLLSHLKSGGKINKSHVSFVRAFRDKNAAGDLCALFRETKHVDLRKAIVQALCAINTRECQPTLREILADTKALRGSRLVNEAMVMGAVWKYNTDEIARFREKAESWLNGKPPYLQYKATSLLTRFKRSGETDVKVALAFARLLDTDIGPIAADALETLTGQRFRYRAPKDAMARKGERRRRGVRTAEDEGITVENTDALEKRYAQDLERSRAILSRNSGLTKAERKLRLEAAARALKSDIDRRRRLLKAKPVDPWDQGIAIAEAKTWITKHYGVN